MCPILGNLDRNELPPPARAHRNTAPGSMSDELLLKLQSFSSLAIRVALVGENEVDKLTDCLER
jgi:hypothetical protein